MVIEENILMYQLEVTEMYSDFLYAPYISEAVSILEGNSFNKIATAFANFLDSCIDFLGSLISTISKNLSSKLLKQTLDDSIKKFKDLNNVKFDKLTKGTIIDIAKYMKYKNNMDTCIKMINNTDDPDKYFDIINDKMQFNMKSDIKELQPEIRKFIFISKNEPIIKITNDNIGEFELFGKDLIKDIEDTKSKLNKLRKELIRERKSIRLDKVGETDSDLINMLDKRKALIQKRFSYIKNLLMAHISIASQLFRDVVAILDALVKVSNE